MWAKAASFRFPTSKRLLLWCAVLKPAPNLQDYSNVLLSAVQTAASIVCTVYTRNTLTAAVSAAAAADNDEDAAADHDDDDDGRAMQHHSAGA